MLRSRTCVFAKKFVGGKRNSITKVVKRKYQVLLSDGATGVFKVKISECQTKAEFSLPGVTYSDFNRFGKVNLWSLAHIAESARVLGLLNPDKNTGKCMVDSNELMKSHRVFLFNSTIKMNPVTYDQRHYMMPLDVQLQLTNIGKTSVSLGKSFYAKGDLFFENTATIVAVDIKKPVPKLLSEKFEKFKSLIQAKESYQEAERTNLQDPGDHPVLRHQTRTFHCDVDFNQHINQSAFVRYCIETLLIYKGQGHAALCDLYSAADFLHPKSMETLYMQELSPGQEIEVVAWLQDADTIRCDIEGRRGTVFKMTINL